ncbi:homogentisate 1,2-dioxygenase [Lutibacter oceani]|uniref:Homogentisate 1,2-dioxygenase n=1 Tax=Lutibacter oceani TaxID=1853311 RepID=A0A3D9S3H1_9FLAO|nr:homogentisate 1,2-dioxygenase [Lutibacter oceani]REE83152.1 homogentisate 1,2-dioxygenase [Lutibacter oceani]
MSRYHILGKVPNKRHTIFENPNGGIYQEELFGTAGFSGISSLLYHINPPTVVNEIKNLGSVSPEIAIEKNMKALSFKGFSIKPENDFLKSRKTLFVNKDLHIGLAAPKDFSKDYFYKNADADEMLFIHKGSGILKTCYGNIVFKYGDYLIIPKGVIYKIDFDSTENRILYVESFEPIFTPKRYRNNFGQLLEHAPFCERDFRLPKDLQTFNEKGNFKIKVKKQGDLWEYIYGNHPFDVVGWDGYHYPFAFSIHDFEPITGRIHMPPPIHQTWESAGFVVCSFVPRKYDYHPKSIPAPYHHSNIDSDELLYYVDGNFMSRNNIEKGQITLHPGGVPHGPHPGAIERSIGKKETQELAVMIDPFKPMAITKEAMKLIVEDYYKSWKV